tara:strand:+ start:1968 stop:2843 length:876 start_codon:yes stop_codon:yes gene_type:complete
MCSISFIGIGLMGMPMAKNILKKNKLTVFNRTIEKAKILSKDGAIIANSIKDAVSNADVIITMLSDDEAVLSIINSQEFTDNIKSYSTVIDMSSIKAKTAIKIHNVLKEKKINFLDAPVSGGPSGAENASLAIMVGGNESTFKKVLDILNLMGKASLVGPIGSGQIAKLANQIIVGVTIGAVAEAIHLCKRAGADPNKFIKAIEGGLADSKILKNHGKKMIDGNYTPGGKTSTHLKDMNNILESANNVNLNLPISGLIKNMYTDLVNNGHSNKDHSSLYLHIEDINKKENK